LTDSDVSASKAPTARKRARADERLVKNSVFITVGLLIKTKLQVREFFQQSEFVVQRFVEHLFGDLIMRISLQLIK
jgi:hypothetical protein